ncbi:MAG: aminotransferase class I/II-fold pyridoxal phosphate-dependent enzyme [Deltaproteobacteria bacterium]
MPDFCSTSYLYLKDNRPFEKSIQSGIQKYGLNFGGSRFNNMCPPVYDEAEKYFSDFLGTEDSLITSSGTLAGVLLTSHLSEISNIEIFAGYDVHPSLLASRMKYEVFDDINNLNTKLRLSKNKFHKYILVNSINPSTLNCLNSEKLIRFKDCRDVTFVIDDSHGLGIIGQEGKGFSTMMKENNLDFVIVASLAKAYGIRGGLISGNGRIISALRNSTLWGGASPSPPFFFHALLESGKIYQEELFKLRENIVYFRQLSSDSGYFKYIDDFPVFLCNQHCDNKLLKKKNMIISSFRYPTKNDPLIQRIVLNSGHTQNQLFDLYSVLKDAF